MRSAGAGAGRCAARGAAKASAAKRDVRGMAESIELGTRRALRLSKSRSPLGMTMRKTILFLAVPVVALAQGPGPRSSNDSVSAPISNVAYEVTFDKRAAASGAFGVRMTFTTDGSGPVILSLPAWTPGAYEISNFAQKVVGFTAAG